MSKKNKKGYSPRHVRNNDPSSAKPSYDPVSGNNKYYDYNKEDLRMKSETAEELSPENKPSVPNKKVPFAARVDISSIEPQEEIKAEEQAPVSSEEPVSEADDTKAADDTKEADKAEKSAEKAPSEPEADEETLAEKLKALESKDAEAPAETDEPAAEAEPAKSADDTANAVAVSVTSAESATKEELAEYTYAPPIVTRRDRKKAKKKKRTKRVVITIIAIPLALIVALAGTFFVMHEIGRRSINESKHIEVVLPTEGETISDVSFGDQYGRIINYNGKSYIYNSDIVTLTFIGVDDGHGTDNELRMADAIYVFAINTKTGKVKMLNVSRDIMTDVDVYSKEGAFISTDNIQIAYSNAYHGKDQTGGENTNKSISRFLFNMPVENYFELNLSAVSTLNDAVGGVTVTSDLTFTSPEDGRTISKGEVVTLHGKEAEYYTRRRDITVLESNNDRMKRQQDYIMSFLGSIVPVAKENPGVIPELYNAISSNSETNLSAAELIYLATTAVTNIHDLSDIEFVKFDGKITAGKNAEMRVSNDEVLQKMLDIFYTPMNTAPTTASADAIASTSAATTAATSPSESTENIASTIVQSASETTVG